MITTMTIETSMENINVNYRAYKIEDLRRIPCFSPLYLKDEGLTDKAKKAQEVSDLLKEKEKLLEVK